MKTLVIHPEDCSTDFLEIIYSGLPKDSTLVIRGLTKGLDLLIEEHDRIIMLGHGSSSGLLCDGEYIIDEKHVELLKKKNDNIYIWCFADEFVCKHELKGFHSGMFISEVEEATMFAIETDQTKVDESNKFFADLLGSELLKGISLEDVSINLKYQYEKLGQTNEVAKYNNERLAFRGNPSKIKEKPEEISEEEFISKQYLNEEEKKSDQEAKEYKSKEKKEAEQLIEDNNSQTIIKDGKTEFQYQLRFEANHLFIELPEGTFLVDTGCPLSFGLTGMITFGAISKPLPTNVLTFRMESLSGLKEVKSRAQAVIGLADLLSTRVLFDGISSIAILGAELQADPKAIKIDIDFSKTFIELTAEIMGKSRKCLFDTGAQYGYVFDKNVLAGAQSAGIIEDYSPIQGYISSESWIADVCLSDKLEIKERFGILTGMIPLALNSFGIEAILGLSWMINKKTWIFPDERAIYIL